MLGYTQMVTPDDCWEITADLNNNNVSENLQTNANCTSSFSASPSNAPSFVPTRHPIPLLTPTTYEVCFESHPNSGHHCEAFFSQIKGTNEIWSFPHVFNETEYFEFEDEYSCFDSSELIFRY